MIASKFGIGQQVRHTLLGYLGVVVESTRSIPLMNRQQTIWPLTQSFAPRPGIMWLWRATMVSLSIPILPKRS